MELDETSPSFSFKYAIAFKRLEDENQIRTTTLTYELVRKGQIMCVKRQGCALLLSVIKRVELFFRDELCFTELLSKDQVRWETSG